MGVIAGLFAGGAAVVGAQSGGNAVHACVLSGPSSPAVPNVRIISAGESCASDRETPLSWNQQGPPAQVGPAPPPNLFSLDDVSFADLGYEHKPGKTKVLKESSPFNADVTKSVGVTCKHPYPHMMAPGGTFKLKNVIHPSATPPHFQLLYNGPMTVPFTTLWTVAAYYGPTAVPNWRLTVFAFCSKTPTGFDPEPSP